MDATKKAKIIRRTVWGAGLALALAAALAWNGASENGAPLAVISGALALLGAVELARMGAVRFLGIGPALVVGGVLALLTSLHAGGLLPDALGGLVGEHLAPHVGLALLAVPALVALLPLPGPRAGTALRIVAAAGLSLWVGFAFARMHAVWSPTVGIGQAAFVSLLVLSKIGDIAGYYVGSAIGKTRPFKAISPGKTTAGCVASLVAGMGFAVVLDAFGVLAPNGYDPLWNGAAWGAAVNLAAQAGDLFESWVKRRATVKDSGTWFGPSGGVLDLVDSLLFTLPLAYFAWPFFLGAG